MPLGTSLICYYFYPLCYVAVLLKFTYYAQYYAPEQNYTLSDYYAVYMQFCMNNSLHVGFLKTVLFKCINEKYQSIPLCSITQ